MCTNQKFIVNPYSHKSVLVPCGHCEACRQQKANRRKLRLLNHCPEGYRVFFFHLTYKPEFVPYCYFEDLILNDMNDNYLTVYREMSCKAYYNRSLKDTQYIYDYGENEIFGFDYQNITEYELNKLEPIGDGSKFSVLYYKDVQDFFKRLRQRYNRFLKTKLYEETYLLQKPIYYFCTGEYGEDKSRCHWHILLYVPYSETYSFFEWWKRTVISCWPFATEYVTGKRFEYAISPSKYVSQYINCSSNVSPFLQRGKIRPSWHYSHGFGLFNPAFNLGFLLRQIERKKVTYTQTFTFKHGRKLFVDLPFPSYFTNRFFPKFKAMWRLSYDEMGLFIRDYRNGFKLQKKLQYEHSDYEQFRKLFNRCIKRYLSESNRNLFDYIHDYIEFYKSRFKYMISQQYSSSLERDVIQSYDNIKIIRNCKPQYFKEIFPLEWFDSPFILNPNEFDVNVVRTNKLTSDFLTYVKQKKLNVCLKN